VLAEYPNHLAQPGESPSQASIVRVTVQATYRPYRQTDITNEHSLPGPLGNRPLMVRLVSHIVHKEMTYLPFTQPEHRCLRITIEVVDFKQLPRIIRSLQGQRHIGALDCIAVQL